MKRLDLINLYDKLDSMSNIKGIKFAYFISKNKKLIKDEVEILKDCIKNSEKFTEYESKRIELCDKMCDKDENGNNIFVGEGINKSYKISNMDSFSKKLNKLEEEYKETLDQRKLEVDEYNKLLGEESNIELVKIKFVDLPEELTSSQVDSILELIEN